MPEPLLKVENLKVSFKIKKQKTAAVEDVNFSLDEGKIIGIVGESGCGKSVTATSILRLMPPSLCEIDENSKILFQGKDLSKASNAEMRDVRSNKISMIFQEPMTSLNPVYTHRLSDGRGLPHATTNLPSSDVDAEKQCEMLEKVGVPDSPNALDQGVPAPAFRRHAAAGHDRHGALAASPKLLIADEPTTALDVTIQAQILRPDAPADPTISTLRSSCSSPTIWAWWPRWRTTSWSCTPARIVEYGTLEQIFDHPLHPYTNGLLRSIPRINQRKDERLYTIDGTVPTLDEMPKGCRFCTRCKEATQRCWEQDPGMHTLADGHKVRCWKYVEEGGSTDGSSVAGNP